MDWESLLEKTDLADKDCIAQALEQMGIVSYQKLQNLPGWFGRPFICGQGTHLIVDKLNAAIKQSADIPTIMEAAPVEPDPPEPPITLDTPITELELGLPETTIRLMVESGNATVGDVLKGGGDHLVEVPGIGESTKDRVVNAVKAALESQKE